jgi:hypothetical protein
MPSLAKGLRDGGISPIRSLPGRINIRTLTRIHTITNTGASAIIIITIRTSITVVTIDNASSQNLLVTSDPLD